MTTATSAARWSTIREHLAAALTPPEMAGENADPEVNRLAAIESPYNEVETSQTWMLLKTYDRAEGKDQVTEKPVSLDDAVVVVGVMQSCLVSTDTWSKRKDEAIELAGGRQLSVIVASELAAALPS